MRSALKIVEILTLYKRNSDFSRFDYLGITAGASTPNNIIEEVQKYVRNEF